MQTSKKDVFSNAPWARFLYNKRMQMTTGFWDSSYAADFSQRVQGFKLSSAVLSQIKRNIV